MRCEDYPCCGHTDGLGCDWTPNYSDPHFLCDHENDGCDVDAFDEDECQPDFGYCPDDGCPNCDPDEHAEEFYIPEDQWLDGSYEE